MITIRVRAGVGAGSSDGTDADRLGEAHRRGQAPGEREGADPADLDRIQEFAGQMGLDIIELSPARRSVVLWGTASAIAAAFRVGLAHYDYAGTVRRGQIGPVHLPLTIAHLVEQVSGLDDGLPDPTPAPGPAHRLPGFVGGQLAVLLAAFLIGSGLGVILFRSYFAEHGAPRQADSASQGIPSQHATGVPPNTAAPPAALQEAQVAELEAAAWQSLNAGRLREAQDYFLRVLTLDPNRLDSMRGLVAVRRKMAGDDPRVIRQQVAVYQDAERRGITTEEFYTPSALRALIAASVTAAQELESQQEPAGGGASAGPTGPLSPASPPATDQGSASGTISHPPAIIAQPPAQQPAPSAGRRPQPAIPHTAVAAPPTSAPPAKPVSQPPAPAAPQKPAVPQNPAPPSPPVVSPPVPPVQAPLPSPPAPAAAPAPPPRPSAAGADAAAPPSNRLYMVRIGPVTDHDRATAIEKQLSAGGFPQAQVTTQTGYRVLSEPLPRQVAEKLAATLAARGVHTYTEALTGDTVQLIFGGFATQKDAETLSGRIAQAGYDAWIREAPLYTIRLGPYPEATVAKITDMVRTGAPEAAVAADAVSTQASSGPPAATPQPPAPAPAAAASPSAPAAPAAAAPAPPAPSAPASPAPSNALYMVRIGPVSDRDRAAAVAKQLSAGGFAQPEITAQAGYWVVSEPLPRKAAEDLVGPLAARGLRSYVEPLTADSAQLLFGIFAAQKDAEALSSRIAAAGYDAWIRGGPVYTLHLGPYPQASVTAITDIVRARAPEANVASDPVSTP